jgi:hypothetical protein
VTLDSLGSDVTARLVSTSLAMQRSPARRASLTGLRLSANARVADLLPSDCLPVMATVSRRVARENLLNLTSAGR